MAATSERSCQKFILVQQLQLKNIHTHNLKINHIFAWKPKRGEQGQTLHLPELAPSWDAAKERGMPSERPMACCATQSMSAPPLPSDSHRGRLESAALLPPPARPAPPRGSGWEGGGAADQEEAGRKMQAAAARHREEGGGTSSRGKRGGAV